MNNRANLFFNIRAILMLPLFYFPKLDFIQSEIYDIIYVRKIRGEKPMPNQLPVPVKHNLPTQIKHTLKKAGKIAGYTLGLTGLCAIVVVIPPLAVPALITAMYPSQKLLNETLYTSYPDLAFILKKHGKKQKIYQDIVRPDILKELRGLTNIEKAGFLQLQAIVGMSKASGKDKNGNPITFETDSHGIIQKAFQTLVKLGYIDNYQETYLKESRLIFPKLAFGNLKGLKDKKAVYNIQFQRTDKPIDMEDAKLRRLFPAIFSKRRGLLAKRDYQIVQNPDGTLSIDYHPKQKEGETETKQDAFRQTLQEGMPSLEEQKAYSLEKQQETAKGETEHEVEQTK